MKRGLGLDRYPELRDQYFGHYRRLVYLAQSDDSARVKKDLGTVLALQGKPCGKVVKADKKGENDYEVTCEDGNRYRISIGADERVTVREVK